MRKFFRRYLPKHETLQENRWLHHLGSSITHPALWHLNRRSAAGGVAVGLFCGLIPGPLQMPGAACFAILFRVNLPLSLITTLYTNPFTLIPLYFVAFEIGQWVTGESNPFIPPPEFKFSEWHQWLHTTGSWALGLGKPLGIGLVLLACILSLTGYILVRLAWRIHLVRAWKRRKIRRCR